MEAMLTTPPAKTVRSGATGQAMRIQTASDPTVVVAVDRNCPRVRATAPNRYEPGTTPAFER